MEIQRGRQVLGPNGLRMGASWWLAALLCGCNAQPVAAPDHFLGHHVGESAGSVIRSVLGAPFGEVLLVEADVMPDTYGKTRYPPQLRIIRVNDALLSEDVLIVWSYGGWSAEREERAMKSGMLLEPGRSYRIQGYEVGYFGGSPPGVSDVLVDEFGPPQSRNFGFNRVFRVLTAVQIDAVRPRV